MSRCEIIETRNLADVVGIACPLDVPTAEAKYVIHTRKRAQCATMSFAPLVCPSTKRSTRSLKGEPCRSAIFES
jgi:hypothetical protein